MGRPTKTYRFMRRNAAKLMAAANSSSFREVWLTGQFYANPKATLAATKTEVSGEIRRRPHQGAKERARRAARFD